MLFREVGVSLEEKRRSNEVLAKNLHNLILTAWAMKSQRVRKMKERIKKWLLKARMDKENRRNQDSLFSDAPASAEQLARLLEDPTVRTRLVEVLREEYDSPEKSRSRWQRLGPFLASAGSALIMVLAFFIPSVQDQWDRFQARQVIQRYVDLGRGFMREGKYKLAEQSFAKAFELSESKRLDIDEERLKAKVQEMNENPMWDAQNPEGLEEADFLYLLQLQQKPGQAHERAVTLNCYGVFLAAAKRWREAEEQLREAIRLNPTDNIPYVNLGNLLRDRDGLKEAEEAYRAALRLEEHDGRAQYDLGLVLAETDRPQEAETAFRAAVALEPNDLDLLRALSRQLEKNGKSEEARKTLEQILSLDPTDAEAKRRLQRFPKSAAATQLQSR